MARSAALLETSLGPGEEKGLLAMLEKLSVNYELYRHPAAPTVALMEEFLGGMHGTICKNLVLRDKKQPKTTYLLTALSSNSVHLKSLNRRLGCSNLRFCSELEDMLNVKPGGVTPLAVFEDKEQKVTLLMDQELKNHGTILVHPMHNQATLGIKVEDIVRFCEHFDHAPQWMDLSALPEWESPKVAAKAAVDGQETGAASLLGITTKKNQDFAEWYTQVLVRSEMLEYYDISGCYIVREWGYFIWEVVSRFFDNEIKKMGVKNCCFPMFVSRSRLETEKNHVEGFSPEVAWVTKYGESELSEPIAIRPTSETIMYPAYSKWIRSHRDLPLKLNQWNTVVRWEFKQPTPFIRTREFLWQEGHTAHTTEEEAMDLVYKVLELYKRWYEEFLAVPVLKGIKSEGEKFAGGKLTTTVEGYIPENGRAVQGATSHLLGTNFAKMFDIKYEDEKGEKQLVQQTSWGITTRSVGVMVMTHSDDKGLVLPPRVASIQAVFIPIFYKEESLKEQMKACENLKDTLDTVGVRVYIDDRSNYTPGWKYNHWELKGVPLRMEVGPKDIEKRSVRAVRRDNGAKVDIGWDNIDKEVPSLLERIQNDLLTRAKRKFDEGIVKATEFSEVMPLLNDRKLILLPWCEDLETEEAVRKATQISSSTGEIADATSSLTSGMKPLCIPLDQPEMPFDTKCFWSGKPAKSWTLWGRSY